MLEAIRDRVRMRLVNREQAVAWRPVEDWELAPLTKDEYQAYARCRNRERIWHRIRDSAKRNQMAKWREDQLSIGAYPQGIFFLPA